MTNEQINITIEKIIRPALHGNTYRPPRDFCNDLNAMHEAEKELNNEQKEIYFLDLMCLYGNWPKSLQAIQATAHQRAKVFLQTLEKWEE